jgi:hypothetical protein
MAAGVTTTPWDVEDIVRLLETEEQEGLERLYETRGPALGF